MALRDSTLQTLMLSRAGGLSTPIRLSQKLPREPVPLCHQSSASHVHTQLRPMIRCRLQAQLVSPGQDAAHPQKPSSVPQGAPPALLHPQCDTCPSPPFHYKASALVPRGRGGGPTRLMRVPRLIYFSPRLTDLLHHMAVSTLAVATALSTNSLCPVAC